MEHTNTTEMEWIHKTLVFSRGMIRSFYDAPGGWREEMREIIYAAGIEYAYRDLFMLRGGAFLKTKIKVIENLQRLELGLKYNVFNLDVSYLFSFTQHNPLENTLRFTLGFPF